MTSISVKPLKNGRSAVYISCSDFSRELKRVSSKTTAKDLINPSCSRVWFE